MLRHLPNSVHSLDQSHLSLHTASTHAKKPHYTKFPLFASEKGMAVYNDVENKCMKNEYREWICMLREISAEFQM